MGANNRRVLIVEPDAALSGHLAVRALELGLEPVVCPGIGQNPDCPGAAGRRCPKNDGCGAVLVSLDGDAQAQVASGCAGDALLVISRPTFGAPARVVVADRHAEWPYDPNHMALTLHALADSAVTPRRRSIPQVGRHRA